MSKDYRIAACNETSGYRYYLKVACAQDHLPRLVVIQLNPSTADSKKSDPTIGKVSKWAVENKFGHITFLNLFAIRTPKPTELKNRSYNDLVGARNDAICETELKDKSTFVILAWGRMDNKIIEPEHYQRRLDFLKKHLCSRAIFSVGIPTKEGFPRHGRMWNGDNRGKTPFDFDAHIKSQSLLK